MHPKYTVFIRSLFTLLILAGCTPAWPQESDLDSLEQLLYTGIRDSAKIEIFRQVIWPKTRNDPESALLLTDSLSALAERMPNERAKWLSEYYYGTTYKNQGRFAQSLIHFQRYFDHFEGLRDTVQMTNVLYQLAVINEQIGNYPESLELYNQCLKYEKILGRKGSEATTLGARATLYKLLGQETKAEEDNLKALAIFQDLKDGYQTGTAHLNIANLYSQSHREEEAFHQYSIAQAIADSLDYRYLQGMIAENRGNLLVKTGDYDSALDSYLRSLEVRGSLGRKKEVVITQNKLAGLYLLLDRNKEAIGISRIALDSAIALGLLPELEEAYLNLSSGYKASGDYHLALQFHELYSQVKDSLLNTNISRQLAEMDAVYETSKKQSEIEALSFETRLQDIQLKQQRWALLFAVIGITSLIFLLRNIRIKSRKIQNQKSLIEKSLNEKEVLLKEIHHRVKNNLQVISSLLKLQSRSIGDKNVQDALDEGRRRVQSMAIIHRNLYQHDTLTGISMKDYLEELGSELLETYKVNEGHIDLELEVADLVLDVDTAVPIGLIVNELISNSLKYGFPQDRNGIIRLSLALENEHLSLTIEDNGIGFKKEDVDPSSFGHRMIRSFAERLSAEFTMSGDHGVRASFLIKDFQLAA